ncbi:MAG: stage sporulation protein cell division protein FtsW [Candidatus Parcubacteria bacterium]|jgi:cell division protein FtsW
MKNLPEADKTFGTIVILLVGIGFFIFVSALLGLLARDSGLFSAIAINQSISLVVGLVGFYVASRIKYSTWNKYAFYLFIGGIIATALVFVPHLGLEHAGAKRWLDIFGLSIQPAEIIKFAFVLYLAAWYAMIKQQVATWSYGLGPLAGLLGAAGLVLAFQPDFGTFIILAVTGFGMLFVAGGSWKQIAAVTLSGIVLVAIVTLSVPYIKSRVLTFVDPSRDPQGAGYQIQQSLIAVGSGNIFGRGFGQSIQKFNFLPEPVGDSIFAVFAEEWGFVGSVLLILLFSSFFLRGFRIAKQAPTTFARLTVIGFVTMITAQSFMNIGSMLGVFPLTGDPLVFVSQGGTSLVMVLVASGIILNISRYSKSDTLGAKQA